MSKYECIRDFQIEKIEVDIFKMEYCFKVKPQNKISYPGMKISRMTILEPAFAKSIINKKVQRKIDLYLAFLASIEDEEDTSEASFILDDLLKFKEILLLKYSKYLSKRELAKLLKEVSFVESKLRMKVYAYDNEKGFGKGR